MDSLILLDTVHFGSLSIALITGASVGWLFCMNLRWAVVSMLNSRQPARVVALSALLRIVMTVGACTVLAYSLGGLYVIPTILTFIISRRVFTSIYINQTPAGAQCDARVERRI